MLSVMEHRCAKCFTNRSLHLETKWDIANCLRVLESRPGTPIAKANAARLKNLRAKMAEQREWLVEHEKLAGGE
jgi:hypothetical protein